jgi:nicotinamidase-related amidase
MYSAFRDPLRVCDSGLAALLRDAAVTHVFVVGLAADYCVRSTAEDAAREGFVTVVVDEGTRPVDTAVWETAKARGELLPGLAIVSVEGAEVRRVGELGCY